MHWQCLAYIEMHTGLVEDISNNVFVFWTAGKAKVEPYSYYKFDRTLLNRRRGKAAGAAGKLSSVVEGAAAGAAKGAKAKRMSAVKKRRTG